MSWYENKKHDARFWLLRHLPSCKETVKVISESKERSLSVREKVLLKLHLWVCMWCQRYMEQLQMMRDGLRARGERAAEDEIAAPGLSDEARARIRQKLSNL